MKIGLSLGSQDFLLGHFLDTFGILTP
jgi:hypothetical protein